MQYVRGVLRRTRSHLGWHGHTMPPITVRLYCTVVQPEDGQYTGPKHVVVYSMYYSV
jgi:hypothetical protein